MTETTNKIKIPEDVHKTTFFKKLPYELDEEQWKFIEAVWNKNNIGVMVNARAGSSKTTLSIGMALLMAKEYQMYDKVYYIVSPCNESRLGYMPGTIEDKLSAYLEPLNQALITWGYNPKTLIATNTKEGYKAQKEGNALITATSDVFLRGQDLAKSFVIIDEAQNYNLHDLKKTLSRFHDDCKVLIIGHTGQIDLKYPGDSGFSIYLTAADKVDFIQKVELTKNYRGKFSNWADSVN